MRDPKTLREAYVLYRENKMQRRDFVGQMVSAIEALEARIGSVDEAAVAALDKRVTGMETTIGNALTKAGNDDGKWMIDWLRDGRARREAPVGEGAGVTFTEPEVREFEPAKRSGWPKGKPRKPKPDQDTAPAVAGD